MSRFITIAALALFTSCSTASKESVVENSQQKTDSSKNSEADSAKTNTTLPDIGATDLDSSSSPKTNNKNKKADVSSLVGTSAVAGDNNFNGEPLVQHIRIEKKIYEKHSDTLNDLAIQYYKNNIPNFPRAIADNFETGTAKEKIIYPEKLVFSFHLFENEKTIKPYLIKDITVRRKKNGELYTL